MDYTVLAADDEKELLDVLELYFQKENIRMIKAVDGQTALDLFKANTVHLVLLDVMMPNKDGFAVLREIRKTSHVPAIMITARSEDYDKILGLELGADDYITKPFNPLEVVARIKAQLRRNYRYETVEAVGLTPEANPLKVGELVLLLQEGSLTKNGEVIILTSTELKILHLLMSQPGRVFTKQQIYESVWEEYYMESDSSVLVHISNLRNKIENNPKKPEILKTIKGLGYKVERQKQNEG